MPRTKYQRTPAGVLLPEDTCHHDDDRLPAGSPTRHVGAVDRRSRLLRPGDEQRPQAHRSYLAGRGHPAARRGRGRGVLLGFESVDGTSVDVFGGTNAYFQMWALYRFGLALLVVVPLFIGLATIVVPMQVGSTNIAFPGRHSPRRGVPARRGDPGRVGARLRRLGRGRPGDHHRARHDRPHAARHGHGDRVDPARIDLPRRDGRVVADEGHDLGRTPALAGRCWSPPPSGCSPSRWCWRTSRSPTSTCAAVPGRSAARSTATSASSDRSPGSSSSRRSSPSPSPCSACSARSSPSRPAYAMPSTPSPLPSSASSASCRSAREPTRVLAGTARVLYDQKFVYIAFAVAAILPVLGSIGGAAATLAKAGPTSWVSRRPI
ncbi:MAG: hypothetical protein R2695_18005 [Acidimicrobiales bacterium]